MMKKRKLYPELFKEKDKKTISIIIGARQVGKTTLLNELYNVLSKTNKCLFLDLDILSNFEKVASFESLLNTLRLKGYEDDQEEFFYLFLDEFQHYSDLSIIMKNVYDHTNNIKIYATGSSSLGIKKSIQESLAGRKKLHYLFPLDFEEFLWFKEQKSAITEYHNAKKLIGAEIKTSLTHLLNEHLIFGGYPAVVLATSCEDKKDVLASIFDLYVKKELVEYLSIKKAFAVKKLIEYFAINNGQKTRFEEVSNQCLLSLHEVKQFTEILKETFLITELRPFFTNKNKELVKISKIYFLDNGVRNYFINNFNEVSIRSDVGFLFEGFVLSELIKQKAPLLKYWQNKKKQEVDVIIDKISEQIAIEIKYKTRLKKEDFKGLEAFQKEYKNKELFLINLSVQKKNRDVNIQLPFNLSRLLQ